MTRYLAALALLTLPAVASAQNGNGIPSGPPVLGGRAVIGPPITNGASALYPVAVATPPRFSVGGGSMSGPPPVWSASGAWGGVNHPWPVYPIEDEFVPVPGATAVVRGVEVTTRQPAAPREATATLVVQFPAAAELWVGGKKSGGDPAAEWILTSPPLGMAGSHTFEVKGRWSVGGRMFEVSRSVTVTGGDRNRTIVVSGTEVKQ